MNIIDVVMLTYNHEDYIAQAIESVLSQDLDCRLIIGEDKSTDNTLTICNNYKKKYPHKIELLANTRNLGLIKNYENCFSHCQSKYIAILEGDDFWVDNSKLKKQVAILENNETIGFVHGNLNKLYEDTGLVKKRTSHYKKEEMQGEVFNQLFYDNFIFSLTVIFRRSLLQHIDFTFLQKKSFITIDFFLWQIFSKYSQLAYVDDILATYRVIPTSIYHDKSIEKSVAKYKMKLSALEYYRDHAYISDKMFDKKMNHINYDQFLLAIKSHNITYILQCAKKLSPRVVIFRVVKSIKKLLPFI